MAFVREINDPHELAEQRLLWNALLGQTRSASFFQTLDWLLTYWRHYGQGQRLRVLIVSTASSPLGILPLVVRREATRIGPIRVLTYPLHDWGVFYGPIGPHPAATLLAGLRHVGRTPRDWDLFDLRWVDEEGADATRTRRALELVGLTARRRVMDEIAMVTMDSSWNAYWGGRKSHWRTNYRRNERRLAALGQVALVRHRPAGAALGDLDPRWDLYDAAERLAARSWQGQSTTGTTLSHIEVRAFLRDAHRAAARAGAADLNLLTIDGRPVAFAYNYHHAGDVFGLRMGHDADAAFEGAGSVLLGRMLEDSFARGDRLLNLGADYPLGKRYWTTHVRHSYRYTHFAPIWRAQLLRAKRWLTAG